ncbi:unnamed protein product [Paramecium octaurelia]|uniref:Uncharacterized protein n=1 Tax=Paramecium octaurelia TaxID=43137 RepID=A0A8S1UQ33_PAROT|nr:unnamed protein product [Paramecium octaurelia]
MHQKHMLQRMYKLDIANYLLLNYRYSEKMLFGFYVIYLRLLGLQLISSFIFCISGGEIILQILLKKNLI